MKLLVVPCLFAAALAAQAPSAPPMKMGLWEITSTTQMSAGGLPAGMPGMGPRTMVIQSCITPESYQKNFTQSSPQMTKDCVRSNEVFTDKKMSFDLSCNKGKMTGHFEATFESMEAGHSAVELLLDSSKPNGMKVNSTGDAKWLSAECGAVTPDKPVFVKK